ncbi:aromatic-ring-hydroxylating dioxygenase subunit beta [Streptomyces sp. SID10853]|uniref:aromatic-ring-hydroxylating dioxygenase subunit beta n=1 Tax=Streptomyces sp. SID10853 TaxID=2706028 RepID=UPI0013C09FDE|nr:aromatic-ring-hydroxylating dioxygenase subunit beta [Streptomyces sp. SID10853]
MSRTDNGMPRVDDRTLRAAVEEFLYAEAELLDTQDYAGWLGLFSSDALYWIPAAGGDADPTRAVSIVHDDYGSLSERVWRFDSGLAYAQEPRSRTAHLVTNVRVTGVRKDESEGSGGAETVEAEANFLTAEFRKDVQHTHAGRCRYLLRRSGGEFRITRKTVELLNSSGYLGNLSLLL